jgi:hypothetical protein
MLLRHVFGTEYILVPGIAYFLQLVSRSRLRRASVELSVTIYLGVMS